MSEVTKAEALQDRVVPGNEALLDKLPSEGEFKLHTVFTFRPEAETYSGEAVECSGYGFFKDAELSNEALYTLAGVARDEIKNCGCVPLKIRIYVAPVRSFRRSFYLPKRDYRPVKVTWIFHDSPILGITIALIVLGVALAIGSVGFLIAVVKSKPSHFTGAIEAVKEAASALPKTAKWLAIGAALVALVTLTRS